MGISFFLSYSYKHKIVHSKLAQICNGGRIFTCPPLVSEMFIMLHFTVFCLHCPSLQQGPGSYKLCCLDSFQLTMLGYNGIRKQLLTAQLFPSSQSPFPVLSPAFSSNSLGKIRAKIETVYNILGTVLRQSHILT